MLGFSERRFIILNPDQGGPFCWFQSVDNPDLAFVVVDPAQFVPDYKVKLSEEEHQRLLLKPGEEVVLLAVVTMAPDPRKITVNLKGPIAINPARMAGMQLVLEGNHSTRHLLFAPVVQALSGKIKMESFSSAMSRVTSHYNCANSALSYA
jgi:flagellar assembly factor FliW